MDTVKVLQEIELKLLKTQSEMILIPGGTFLMGSSEITHEGPQHEVTVSPFLMGRYPVTQAQWRAVTSLPLVERELDPDPSYFDGNNRPVEQVNWYDAMEFCARLSVYTQQTYTLPSEAQWEYACLANTTKPFHISETITPATANYNAYGHEGVFRQETTNVGSFPQNNFGLCDMQGNVWEWCLDHWHKNYHGAPADGRAWVTGGNSGLRMLRGGSWFTDRRACRSACRLYGNPDNRYIDYGFRVVSL